MKDQDGNIVPDYKIDFEDLIINISSSKAFNDKDYQKIKEKVFTFPRCCFPPLCPKIALSMVVVI